MQVSISGGEAVTEIAPDASGVATCNECGAITRIKLGGFDVDGRKLHSEWHDHQRRP